MVGQRAAVVRVAESRPRGALARPAERVGRSATGAVSPRLVVRVPVLLVKARGLAAMVPGALLRHLRRGRRERPAPRRPMARSGRAAHLPPKVLAGKVALAARHRVTSCAVPRPRATVTGPAGRPVRRAQARREQVRLTAGHAQAGTLRVPPPMTVSGMAAGGPRGAPSSAARAGLRPLVSSAAVRGPRRPALRVTGPGPRGRTGPGRRARKTASVTAAGRQIATSAVMRAVRLRAVVPGVQAATTAPQRATGRVVPVAGMAPHMTVASVLTTGT
jgi:hypothetical protein